MLCSAGVLSLQPVIAILYLFICTLSSAFIVVTNMSATMHHRKGHIQMLIAIFLAGQPTPL